MEFDNLMTPFDSTILRVTSTFPWQNITFVAGRAELVYVIVPAGRPGWKNYLSNSERKIIVADLAGKKLPTVEQVETIIAEYGCASIDDFAERFGLERIVIEAVVDCLRRLRRLPEGVAVPAIACYRDDNIESIVRCAGSKHGYV